MRIQQEKQASVSLDRVRSLLFYNPNTGCFTRNIHIGTRSKNRDRAESKTCYGYWSIYIDGVRYQAHRVAWFYHYGEWPIGMIDHINRDRLDNRISNLRIVTYSENHQNRSSVNGYVEKKGRFYASIVIGRKRHYLGAFGTADDARAAYLLAKKRIHPTSPINFEKQEHVDVFS